MDYHTSVLLKEAIEYLNVQEGNKYIDATLGGGGHSLELLRRGAVLLGIDVDEDALDVIRAKIKNGANALIVRGNFREIGKIAKENGFEKVNGILYDLGVSSHQFDAGERGFSFQQDAQLDMRMDRSLNVKAKDLINALSKKELDELFSKLGEERFASSISKKIIKARSVKPIETTHELAHLVKQGYPFTNSKIHPATKIFQALRIAVNDELGNLRDSLPQAVDLLTDNGRLVVISFHSLEDRIVKETFKEFEKKGFGKSVSKKPILPTQEEVVTNNRSRSAKMRVFEKEIV